MPETTPVAVQENEAAVDVVAAGGVLVSVTVGLFVLDLIVHVKVVDALPFAFATVTRNVWTPGASPV